MPDKKAKLGDQVSVTIRKRPKRAGVKKEDDRRYGPPPFPDDEKLLRRGEFVIANSKVYDVRARANPRFLRTKFNAGAFRGGKGYTARESAGNLMLRISRFRPPDRPVEISDTNLGATAILDWSQALDSSTLVLIGQSATETVMKLVDVSDSAAPVLLATYDLRADFAAAQTVARGVFVKGSLAVVPSPIFDHGNYADDGIPSNVCSYDITNPVAVSQTAAIDLGDPNTYDDSGSQFQWGYEGGYEPKSFFFYMNYLRDLFVFSLSGGAVSIAAQLDNFSPYGLHKIVPRNGRLFVSDWSGIGGFDGMDSNIIQDNLSLYDITVADAPSFVDTVLLDGLAGRRIESFPYDFQGRDATADKRGFLFISRDLWDDAAPTPVGWEVWDGRGALSSVAFVTGADSPSNIKALNLQGDYL